MQILRYHSTTGHTHRTRPCEHGKPITFQVFFSAFANECIGDYEPDYFAFDFANNGYGTFKDALEEDTDIDEALSGCGYNVLFCE